MLNKFSEKIVLLHFLFYVNVFKPDFILANYVRKEH